MPNVSSRDGAVKHLLRKNCNYANWGLSGGSYPYEQRYDGRFAASLGRSGVRSGSSAGHLVRRTGRISDIGIDRSWVVGRMPRIAQVSPVGRERLSQRRALPHDMEKMTRRDPLSLPARPAAS